MEKIIERYYKREFRGKRTRIGQCVDVIFLAFIIALTAYIWFRSMRLASFPAVVLSIVVAICATVAYVIIRSARYEGFVIGLRKKLANELAQADILTMPYCDFCDMACALVKNENAHLYCFQNAEELNADAVLCVYKSALTHGAGEVAVVSVAPLSASAKKLSEKLHDIQIKTYSVERMITDVAAKIDSSRIDELVRRRETEHANSRKNLFKSVFAPSRITPYFILGGVLMILSLFARYALYYKSLGALCIGMGIAIAALTNKK